MKFYSLRRATFTALIAPMLVALVLVAVSGFMSAGRTINSLRDHDMAQEAAFLMTLSLHEGAEGEKIGMISSPEAFGLDQIEKQGTGFRIWAGNSVITSDGTLPPAGATAPPAGLSGIEAQDGTWRRFVMRHPTNSVTVEVAEPQSVRTKLLWRMVASLVLPMLLLVMAVSLIASLRVAAAMRPMDEISGEIGRRETGDLAPLTGRRIPREIAPLVAAINDLMARLGRELDREREFTDNAAHELRTPLAALKMRAQLAAKALAGQPEQRQMLSALDAAIDRMTGVVEQLLLLSRMQQGSAAFAAVDLSRVVEGIVRELAPAAVARHQQLEVELPAGLAVRGSADALAMLARNLIENAIRHSHEGGKVLVSLARTEDHAILTVEDNGPGMAEADLSQAFERFTRFSDDTPGSGLGLALVRRIAENHGAEVKIRNRDQGGLCCELSIPIAA